VKADVEIIPSQFSSHKGNNIHSHPVAKILSLRPTPTNSKKRLHHEQLVVVALLENCKIGGEDVKIKEKGKFSLLRGERENM
jgi:hypothetical protein